MNRLLLFAQEHGEEVVTHTDKGVLGDYMWLVPLLPVLSFFVILFFGRKMKNRGHAVGIAAVGIGLLLSLAGFVELAAGNAVVEKSWTWFELGESFHLEFGMNYDFLTGIMFVVVTTVSLLVHIYSTGYMHDDERYTIFFAMLSLFTGSMLFMVIANNLLQLFVGWELVGVCSYFLIGHYWEEKENSSAAMKAFITNRVGDMAFLFGIFVLFGSWLLRRVVMLPLAHTVAATEAIAHEAEYDATLIHVVLEKVHPASISTIHRTGKK